MRPEQVEEALYFHACARQPVILLGDPGGGKSSIFRKVFKRVGLDHHTINLALSDGTDMKGMPTFVEHGEHSMKAIKWAKETVFLENKPMAIFLDEIFQGQTQVQNAAAPILLENRIDDVFLHPGSWVCAASNRMENKAGTNRAPSHIPNRATILFGPEANVDDWGAYILEGGASKEVEGAYVEPIKPPTERSWQVVQYIRMDPNALSDFDPSRMVNSTQRQWEWVAQWIDLIPSSVRYPILAGRVGEGYATKLNAFLKVEAELPSKEQILMNPKKAKVPTEPSALYLVTGMLAQASNATTFDSITVYADRIPPEFQAMLVKDAMRIAPEVTSTKAFVTWGVKFADVLR